MLAHLAQASRRPQRSWLAFVPRRSYAEKADGSKEDPFKAGPSFNRWLREEGAKFKDPRQPKNWLGGRVPFPLNPSFKPPSPISDTVRTAIWDEYMANPSASSLRELSYRFGISLARVDAILRLKGLEEHWRKGKQLQTGFLKNMEYILDVPQKRNVSGPRQAAEELGEDAVEADAVSEATKNIARARYQRLFWEPVVDGKEPVMDKALSRATQHGLAHIKATKEAQIKSLGYLKSEVEPDVVVERSKGPTLRFVDVGTKFVNLDDHVRRAKVTARRARKTALRQAVRAGRLHADRT